MSSKIEPKTSQNDITADIKAFHRNCTHCRKNPQAERPFSKMKRIAFNEKQQKILEEVATQYKVDPGCVLCLSIENFMKLPNDAKRLELLKGKN